MASPETVDGYLLSVVRNERSPAYLASDDLGNLIESGGALEQYGLTGLQPGVPVGHQAFFLEGLLPLSGDSIFLPCVKTESGPPADIHIFKSAGRDWTVLLSATSSDAQARVSQQRTNALSLKLDAMRNAAAEASRGLLAALFNAIDVAVFLRTGTGRFQCVNEAPEWLLKLWPGIQSGVFVPGPEDYFLSNFLLDAETLWAAKEHGRLRSGVWVQEIDGQEQCFEASAIATDEHALLLVEYPRYDHEERQRLIQTARERGLDISLRERREKRLNQDRISLEDQVDERMAELLRLNQILQWELGQRTKAENQIRVLLQGIQSTADMIVVVDQDLRISFVNQAFLTAHGYQQGGIIGQPLHVILPSTGSISDLLSAARNSPDVREQEHWQARKNGELFPVQISATAVRGDDRAVMGYMLVMRSLEEKRRADEALQASEERFRHAQKMEAIGKLAGGVAHDFNNLLTVILGYCELLLSQTGKADPRRAEIEGIFRAGERAAALTHQLLAFSRKQILRPSVVDLKATIHDTSKLLERVIGEDVEFRVHCDPDLGKILADPDQIHQVILNLAVNARDAMPEGGRLALDLRNVDFDERSAQEHGDMKAGPYVQITISDSGMGIPADVLPRIFEPFFTTKPEGTGLGLSTVYGIVEQSGGKIRVRSELGTGTSFEVYLPRLIGDEAEPARHNPPPIPHQGSETVLVVEDEESLRKIIRRALESNGYHVRMASNASEALDLARSSEGPIDLLLTDLVMPGMGGETLAAEMLRTFPDIRILFMSGYTDRTAVISEMIKNGAAAFLPKPFSPSVLVRRVGDVLTAD